MSTQTTFDPTAAHKYFSGACFNRTWEFLDQQQRSANDELEMLHACLASLYHWTCRDDCQPRHRSVGYWQASRVFALLGKAEMARRYGELSLEQSAGDEPFYAGYAHEALARAALVAGDRERAAGHLTEAQRLAALVAAEADRELLAADLKQLENAA